MSNTSVESITAKYEQQRRNQQRVDEYRDLLHQYTMKAMEGILVNQYTEMLAEQIASEAVSYAKAAIDAVEREIEEV